jgi:hypothetical protein
MTLKVLADAKKDAKFLSYTTKKSHLLIYITKITNVDDLINVTDATVPDTGSYPEVNIFPHQITPFFHHQSCLHCIPPPHQASRSKLISSKKRDFFMLLIIEEKKPFRPYVETKALAEAQTKNDFISEKSMRHLLHLVA